MVCSESLEERDARRTHILEVFKNLASSYDVYLFALKSKTITNKAHNIIFVPNISPIFKTAFYQISLFFCLIYHCFKRSPSAIYNRHSSLSFSSLLISKIFRIPYVVEVNGLILEDMKLCDTPKLIMKTARLIEKLNYRHASKIVAVTKNLKEKIKELYHIPDEKIVVIENGANTDLFKPMDREMCIKELNLDESHHYVCFVGNLAPWQGVEYLIEAAPLILKKTPNTKFLIIGDGMMKEKLVKLAKKTGISDKVIFTGAVPYEKVPKYINASDVCVAPFIKERNLKTGLSPLKIYEYLSCEKPVVSTQIPGLEFIEKEHAGILVEPENPKELAKAIVTLLNDRKLRNEMGKNGRKYVVENHSWKLVAKRVAEVCERV